MLDQIEQIKNRAEEELAKIDEFSGLEAWRVRYLGKKSELTQVLRGLATLSIDDKKAVGSAANALKTSLEESFVLKEQKLNESRIMAAAAREAVDITLPGRRLPTGHHLVHETIEEICSIFNSMGFRL
jgi:phenylalanyl-tRNA synthetase alpha chain